MKLLLIFLLSSVAALGQGVSVFPAQVFTGDTSGMVMQLNSPPSTGSASVGAITLVGTSLTTVTFTVEASTDGGLNYFPAPVYTVASPSIAASTPITATASGQYYINLAGVTHLQIVTSGTFTATSVSFQLTTSPNAGLPKIPPTAPISLPLDVTNGGTGTSQAPSTTGQVCISQSTTFCTPQTVTGDGALSQTGALAIVSLGGLKPPLRIGATGATLFSGTTSQTKTLLSSTPAAGTYQACAYIDVTVAATAGTFQPAITFTSDGNTLAGQNVFPAGAIAATGQWNQGQGCWTFYADISTAITMQLKLTSVTGTPTFRYTFLLFQLQ